VAVPLVVLALGAGGVWRVTAGGSDGGDAAAADGGSGSGGAATGIATVERRDLAERAELDGTLGYGDTWDLALAGGGTLTALPAVGTVIDRGQSVAEVDGRPVPLLIGDRPLWRELGPGVDDGPDVEEIEANLVALGVVDGEDLTVDRTWTSATTAAVESPSSGRTITSASAAFVPPTNSSVRSPSRRRTSSGSPATSRSPRKAVRTANRPPAPK